jgi:hypothetical protein
MLSYQRRVVKITSDRLGGIIHIHIHSFGDGRVNDEFLEIIWC